MLGAEHHALQVDGHDPVIFVERDVGEHATASEAGDVQHGIDAPEPVARGREHRLDLGLVRDVAVERGDGVAELVGRLLLPSADVDREHLGTFPHEHLGRGLRHTGAGTGDDGHLSVELSHSRFLPSSIPQA